MNIGEFFLVAIVSASTSIVCFTVLDLVFGTKRKWKKNDETTRLIPFLREQLGIED